MGGVSLYETLLTTPPVKSLGPLDYKSRDSKSGTSVMLKNQGEKGERTEKKKMKAFGQERTRDRIEREA